MKSKIELHIAKLKRDKSSIQRGDGYDMENILLNLKNRNYDMASIIYSNMDTIVRDDFVEKMTNNYQDKDKMRELADKLKFEWIGETKKLLSEKVESIEIDKGRQDGIIGELLTREKYKFSQNELIAEVSRDIFKLLRVGFK